MKVEAETNARKNQPNEERQDHDTTAEAADSISTPTAAVLKTETTSEAVRKSTWQCPLCKDTPVVHEKYVDEFGTAAWARYTARTPYNCRNQPDGYESHADAEKERNTVGSSQTAKVMELNAKVEPSKYAVLSPEISASLRSTMSKYFDNLD